MSNQVPPEIIILKNKINDFRNKFKGFVLFPLIIIIFFILLPSIYFSVQPDEDAVVLRFGKFNRTVGPGPHFKLPVGLEEARKVKTRTIHKMEFGFQTLRAGIRTEYDQRNLAKYTHESTMLTGDLNVADVEWIVQYRIADIKKYLFNVRHVDDNIRDLSEAVMRRIVGDREVTEVLTYGRLDIEEECRKTLQETLDLYSTGIDVVTVKLQDVNPPTPVKPSFNEVNAAKQESDQLVNEAWKHYNNVIPEARGKAARVIEEAKGYSVERINMAKGDADRFIAFEKEYAKAPQVTKKRLYLETMRKVFDQVDQVYVVDAELKSMVPLFQLNKSQAEVKK